LNDKPSRRAAAKPPLNQSYLNPKEIKKMKKYKGMNFQEWCALDPQDERKINYTLKGVWEGAKHEEHFTSEDNVDIITLGIIQNSVIENIEFANNEWFVVLNY
jgi:hypothetical protein